MKFRWKIFTLCFTIYIVSLAFAALIVSRNTYESLLEYEVTRCIEDEKNLHSSIIIYLLGSQKSDDERLNIDIYSKRIVDIFSSKNNYMDFFTREGYLLATSNQTITSLTTQEVNAAFAAKRTTHILKHAGNRHLIFVNDVVEFNNEQFLMTYIKDISYVDEQRRLQYPLFLSTGLLGLLFIIIITGITSTFLMKPIDNLISATRDITAGNFDKTVSVRSQDEIGILGEQFNIMVMEINKKIRELEDESGSKQRFIDNLTHELRTPLTSVIGYSDLLKGMKYNEESFNKGLTYINSEGRRMLNLINSLMDLILLRQNKLNLEKHSLLKLLQDAAGTMFVRASEKNMIIILSGEDFELNIDRDLIKGAVINLIDNAMKASECGKTIELGLKQDHLTGKKIIYVKDNGKGMDEDEVSRITEPFYRVDKSRSRKEGGMGLGLAIVKTIVNVHGGELLIESTSGFGTTVSLIFYEGRIEA